MTEEIDLECATCHRILIGVWHCNDCYQSHTIPKDNQKVLKKVILDLIRTDKDIRETIKEAFKKWEESKI